MAPPNEPSLRLAACAVPEVDDADEETFLLFSQDLPGNVGLGFVDSKSLNLEIELAGRSYTVSQSPGVLSSQRAGGTTGAVLWKVNPLVAQWLSTKPSILWDNHFLHPEAKALELGCGVSPLLGIAVAPSIQRYVLSDQAYVLKLTQANIDNNAIVLKSAFKEKKGTRSKRHQASQQDQCLTITPFDWEADAVDNLSQLIGQEAHFDMAIVCDCVYNEFLIKPLVQVCVEVSELGRARSATTLVLVAQQLRSSQIMESWLRAMLSKFRVWRVPEQQLPLALHQRSGYVLHLAMLKN